MFTKGAIILSGTTRCDLRFKIRSIDTRNPNAQNTLYIDLEKNERWRNSTPIKSQQSRGLQVESIFTRSHRVQVRLINPFERRLMKLIQPVPNIHLVESKWQVANLRDQHKPHTRFRRSGAHVSFFFFFYQNIRIISSFMPHQNQRIVSRFSNLSIHRG